MTKLIKGVSFFSGGGFMDKGAEMAGIHTAWANEVNPKFATYHAANFHHPDGTPVVTVKSIDDVTKEEIIAVLQEKYGDSEVDIICGGPPCVDLSRINSRKKTGSDSKTRFIMAFLDKIIALTPKVVVMEQIPQLLTDEFHFPLFLETIKKMNYEVKWKVLCALNYEGNSIRKRAIFIFVRRDLGKVPLFPKPIPEGRKMCGEFLDIDSYVSDNFSDRVRSASEPMTTVTSGSPARFFKNRIARKPTVHELMWCQSLDPDTYTLPKGHTYSTFRRVCGNAVPVRLSYNIFKTIFDEILAPPTEDPVVVPEAEAITEKQEVNNQ